MLPVLVPFTQLTAQLSRDTLAEVYVCVHVEGRGAFATSPPQRHWQNLQIGQARLSVKKSTLISTFADMIYRNANWSSEQIY